VCALVSNWRWWEGDQGSGDGYPTALKRFRNQ
jgi:hypothetical protein